ETATVSVLNFNDETLYYTEPGCQGPSYLFAGSHGPRQVFTTGTCSIPRVRPDDLASQEISIASYLYRGISCLPVSGTVRLIPESEMIVVDRPPPDLGACPPLHIERRDPK